MTEEIKDTTTTKKKKPIPENHYPDFDKLGINKCSKCGDKKHTDNGQVICPQQDPDCPFL